MTIWQCDVFMYFIKIVLDSLTFDWALSDGRVSEAGSVFVRVFLIMSAITRVDQGRRPTFYLLTLTRAGPRE